MNRAAWMPKNDVERAMADAVDRGDRDEFLRVFATAKLYLPRAPKAGVVIRKRTEQWEPVAKQVAGRVSVPVFTSLDGMGSVRFAGSYAVTTYDELPEHGVQPEWWLAINPGTPIESYLSVEAVGQVVRGELTVFEGRLMPAGDAGEYEYIIDEQLAFEPEVAVVPDRALHDPTYAGKLSFDEYLEAFMGSTVIVPTTREVVDYPDALFRPDFPWRVAGPGASADPELDTEDTPTIEVFTSDEWFAAAFPDSPGVRMPFQLLMLVWPDGHSLSVNPGRPVGMARSSDGMGELRRRTLAR